MKITNRAFFIVVVSAIGYLLNLILNRYLTHNITPAAYGDFCIGLNALEIASTFLLLGTEISAMRFIPLLEKDNNSLSFIKWNFYFIKKLFYIFVILLFVFFLGLILLDKTKDIHTSFLMLGVTPIAAIYALIIVYLNSQNHIFISTLIDSVLRYILLIATFFLLFNLASVKENSMALSMAYVGVFFILALFTASLYNRKNKTHLPFSIFFSKEKPFFDKHKEWESVSIKYLFSNLIFLFFMYIDKMVLDIVHENEDIVGHYSAVVVLVGLFSLISQSSGIFLSPKISKFIKDKNGIGILQGMIYKANKNMFILFVVLLTTYIFFGKNILGYFGKNGEYTIIYYGLISLSFSQILLEIGNLSMRFLLYGGYADYINKILSVSLAALLIFGIILTYYVGIYGIIIAHILTSFFYMIAFAIKAKKEFGQLKILSLY
ncbi:MAG: oligosaccharide flippase family protein [Sulfurovaceae bacterium]|nr:oligosaccharide flippase family protein [Sulfurovaceae bacterium]